MNHEKLQMNPQITQMGADSNYGEYATIGLKEK